MPESLWSLLSPQQKRKRAGLGCVGALAFVFWLPIYVAAVDAKIVVDRIVDQFTGDDAPSKPRSPLNPHDYPALATCKSIRLDNPAAEASRNVARGDLRPFTVYGFTPGDVPGVFCPGGGYRLDSRGGTFVSDVPDACGQFTFSNAPPEKMEAYNRVLAANPEFQRITTCRPATYCEERYRKGFRDVKGRDLLCPAEPEVLLRVAQRGTEQALSETLEDFDDSSPSSRDSITTAFIAALGQAKWANADLLLNAGADVNGRARDRYRDGRKWLGSPIEAVFNQNGDRDRQIAKARWLFANGADFSNPGASQGLTWAASSNDVAAVKLLLANGASANGTLDMLEQDSLAKGNIQSAGGGFGYGMTPFYAAIEQALLLRARNNAKTEAWADREQRSAEENAVTLYRAGGRFFVGKVYDELRQKPNVRIASVLLAAAHREGRLEELIDRILYPSSDRVLVEPDASNGEKALIQYLQEVRACRKIAPVTRVDHVKLCAAGKV